MANICIIPARGGSKRIPRKNITDFLGKPIVAYSIETAIKSNLFDEVMVSTDDEEIAEIAIKYGATIPFLRSASNSDDYATTFDVINEVLATYKTLGREFETVCCFYPCAPLVTVGLLSKSYDKLGDFDTVFPMIEYGHPIQRSLIMKADKVRFANEENALIRSQDLESMYHDAGQFYICNVSKLLENKSILTKNTTSIIISELEAQDIDNLVDWRMAELKYQLVYEQKNSI